MSSNIDSTALSNEKIKKGWNIGALPAIAFDSDIGFRYGVITNLYNYGDGKFYPRYNHSLYFEWSRTSKGSGTNQLIYDSEALIPSLRITSEASIFTEQALNFYGFNGYNAYYNPDFEKPGTSAYISKVFYRLDRKLTHLKIDIQGNISDRRFRWLAGFSHLNIKINTVDIQNLNKGKSGNDILPNVPLLYDKFVEWGIIDASQKNGGINNMAKAGIIFDTRDNEPNPMRGIWSEVLLLISPSFWGNSKAFSKLAINHREYFTLKKEVLNLAYRLSYQTKINGTMPFYMLPFIYSSNTSTEGLGGSKNLRGVLRDRVVGEDFFYGNIELRWKFLRTYKFKQNFYLALAGFTDFGRVTGKYAVTTSNSEANLYLSKGSPEKWHQTYGLGAYAAMNQNFVAALNYGIPVNKNDGNSGLYIGLNFLF
jgi:Outer membrane protein/protective antigen OMA87